MQVFCQLHHDQSATLWAIDEAGQRCQHETLKKLSDYPETLRKLPLTVLLPGECVTTTAVTLPKLTGQALQNAIPFAIEEQIAEPIEQLYCATTTSSTNKTLVMIINKTRWETYLETLSQYDLQPQYILPDYLALPTQVSQWHVVITKERALVRCNEAIGFATQTCLLPALLTRFLNTLPRPETLLIDCHDTTQDLSIFSTLGLKVVITHRQWIDCLKPQHRFNLLQGRYRRKQQSHRQSKYWRACYLAGIAAITLLVAGQLSLLASYKHQSAQLSHRIAALYQRIFPTQKITGSPRIAVLQRLADYPHSHNQFLILMDTLGNTLKQYPKARLQAFHFDHQQLTVSVDTPDLSQVTQLTNALKQAGLSVKNNHYTIVENHIHSQMSLTQ